MAKRLFVGNLPYGMDDAGLGQLFAEAGEVASATVITDRQSGRSKGFGFVEMSTDKEAEEAIAKLNGKKVGEGGEERAIVVNEARPREERPQGPGRDR